jgi:hypothetical protein
MPNPRWRRVRQRGPASGAQAVAPVEITLRKSGKCLTAPAKPGAVRRANPRGLYLHPLP